MSGILPPRKRDWKPGDHQLGLFIRFPAGELIEVTINAGKPDEIRAALELLRLTTRKQADREAGDRPQICGCPNACPVHS
jgi:hypothetical protein